jgi:WD40 repeat protein
MTRKRPTPEATPPAADTAADAAAPPPKAKKPAKPKAAAAATAIAAEATAPKPKQLAKPLPPAKPKADAKPKAAAAPPKAPPGPAPFTGALRPRHTLDLQLEKVLALAARPGLAEVAVANRTGRILAIDTRTGARLREYRGHTAFVSALSYAPDGAHLLSGGNDKTMRVWDADTAEYAYDMAGILHGSPRATTLMGQMMRTSRPGHALTVLSVTHAPGGLVGSGGQDRCAKIWRDGQLLRTLDFHDGPVTAVAFRPCAETLLSASEDRILRLWSHLDGRMVHKYAGHTAAVRAVAWLDADRFLSADDTGAVLLWDAPAEAVIAQAHLPCGVRAIALTPGADLAFAGTESGDIASIAIQGASLAITHQHPAHPDTIRAMALDLTSNALISAGHDGSVRIWELS